MLAGYSHPPPVWRHTDCSEARSARC